MKIEQIAMPVENLRDTQRLFGTSYKDWTEDVVKNRILWSKHRQMIDTEFELHLAFNYTLVPGIEFELLKILGGKPYQSTFPQGRIGHIGFHTRPEMSLIAEIESQRQLNAHPVQVSVTTVHLSPKVTGRYMYALLDTVSTIGCLTKIIHRLKEPESYSDSAIEYWTREFEESL